MRYKQERKPYIKYDDNDKMRARNIDLIDYLEKTEGLTFKQTGSSYRCEQHNSFVIQQDRKRWYWNSRGSGGNNVIDYLMTIHNIEYTEAMKMTIGESHMKFNVAPKKPKVSKRETKEFNLPQKASNYKRVFAYLIKTRGIDSDIVKDCVAEGKLYQDLRNNCVFVGYDENNQPKFASVRGTLTDKQYRGDCKGSDKSYSFHLAGTTKTRVFVFESPIDCLSHATLTKLSAKEKGRDGWEDFHKCHERLSLGGTTDVALENYIKTNPNLRKIVFCLDNDEAGLASTQKYLDKYKKLGFEVSVQKPKDKDFNNDLKSFLNKKNINQPQLTRNVGLVAKV